MQEYIDLGYMKPVIPVIREDQYVYYATHRQVIRKKVQRAVMLRWKAYQYNCAVKANEEYAVLEIHSYDSFVR